MHKLVENADADLSRAEVLIDLVPPIRGALEDYHFRAVHNRQSFAHIIMLGAAVEGWHVFCLTLIHFELCIELQAFGKGWLNARLLLAGLGLHASDGDWHMLRGHYG